MVKRTYAMTAAFSVPLIGENESHLLPHEKSIKARTTCRFVCMLITISSLSISLSLPSIYLSIYILSLSPSSPPISLGNIDIHAFPRKFSVLNGKVFGGRGGRKGNNKKRRSSHLRVPTVPCRSTTTRGPRFRPSRHVLARRKLSTVQHTHTHTHRARTRACARRQRRRRRRRVRQYTARTV